VPDLLAVSYSGSDKAGHAHGAESPEWAAALECVDGQVARLLAHLDREFGRNATPIVLTADHGVGPLPVGAGSASKKPKGGRVSEDAITARVNAALVSAYGDTYGATWVAFHDFPNVWLNESLALAKGVSLADAARVAQAAVVRERGIMAAYTREELQALGASGTQSKVRPVLLSFDPERSGHVVYQVERFHIVADAGSNHGSHWGYDAHVPLMWLGPGIRAGSYGSPASPVDIAPTLLALLGIRDRPEMNGCVLEEVVSSGVPACDRRRLSDPMRRRPG
jgi:arylsulfatase A-like enzyme